MDQAKSTLRIWKRPAGFCRKPAAHPPVHPPAQPRQGEGVVETIANDQRGGRSFLAVEEERDVVGPVLPVPIQRDGPCKTTLVCVRQAGAQGRAFALIPGMLKHTGSSSLGLTPCVVCRTVVHHDYFVNESLHLCHQRRDGSLLVEARHDNGTCSLANHDQILGHVCWERSRKDATAGSGGLLRRKRRQELTKDARLCGALRSSQRNGRR